MIEDLKKDVLMKGLSEEQAAQSKKDFGTNELAKKEQESLWSMFIGAFDDIWIKVLCGALVLKIALAVLGMMIPALGGENDAIEIVSIILAIGLATGFSTLSEYRNTSRSEALQEEYNKTYAKVIRGGKLIKILISVGTGIVVCIACWLLKATPLLNDLVWWQSLLYGLAVGLSGCGFYDIVKAIGGLFGKQDDVIHFN